MIRVIRYNKDKLTEDTLTELADLKPDPALITWIDLTEPPVESDQAVLSGEFGIHPLTISSLFDGVQHPRLLEYENHVFLNARAIHQVPGDGSELTGLAVVLGKQYVLTAHRDPLDLLDRTLERVRNNAGHVRNLGSDHLFYMLLDGLVDDYFALVDAMSETIDDIDARAGEQYEKRLYSDIMVIKRRVLIMHRAISPMRDALLNLRRTDSKFISDHTAIYIRDAFEHLLQLLETVDTYREVLSSTSELMMSAASNRMNEVITALTLITSLFIPITFIAGFYGMNLMMPEFKSQIAYPIVIGVMVATVIGMFVWFRRKKWL